MMWCKYIETGKAAGGRHEYRCKKCGHERVSRYSADMMHRACDAEIDQPHKEILLSLPDRLHFNLAHRPDVTRTPDDLDRIITLCTTQCERLGTGQWGETKYEGCPRFGRPCKGAFDKWIDSLADAAAWCNHWGPEQGVFHELTETTTNQ